MTLNKMLVIGNLGQDPEMRYLPSGSAVTNFSVASNNKYTRSDGSEVDETEWFRVSAWGKQAEACNQYLNKGSKVYVEGRLKSSSYQTQDGTTRFTMEINADKVVFLSSRQDDAVPAQGPTVDDVDDLPW